MAKSRETVRAYTQAELLDMQAYINNPTWGALQTIASRYGRTYAAVQAKIKIMRKTQGIVVLPRLAKPAEVRIPSQQVSGPREIRLPVISQRFDPKTNEIVLTY